MDVSPQEISTQTFAIVKKGYDPAAVRTYLTSVSKALESSQQQATAMEARARAAVAKLQELSQPAEQPAAAAAATTAATTEDSETISRTLLLAQRTADGLISEARAEADTMVNAARAEASGMIADAQQHVDVAVEEGRVEGRRAFEAERSKAESEVQALLARRDFLLGDVEQLEAFVATHRQRLRDLADSLQDTAEHGLGDLRRPLLSAAADTPAPSAPAEPEPAPDDAGSGDAASGSQASGAADADGEPPVSSGAAPGGERADEASASGGADSGADRADEPTQAISSLAGFVDDVAAPGEASDAEPTPPGNPRLLDFGA